MAATLEIYDGSTTIDLLDSSYNAALPVDLIPAPARAVYAGRALRGVTREPRSIRARLVVKGSSVSDLRTKLRDLESMLATAERRQSSGYGTTVVLKCQMSNTDSEDIEFRVMWGELEIPPSALDEPTLSSSFAVPGVGLHLVCEPFGRLSSVSVSADTLENEQDSTLVNYIDIQSITGTKSALMQLKIHDPNNGGGNAWNGSKKMWIARRSGERRTDDLFIQGEEEANLTEGSNPGGANTSFKSNGALSVAAASGGEVAQIEWSQDAGSQGLVLTWINAGYIQYDITGGNIPSGLYRVLVRGQVTSDISAILPSDMGLALGWTYGAKSKTPVSGDEVYPSALSQYEIFDLGELTLEPTAIPDGFTAPTFSLRIHGTYLDSSTSNVMGYLEYLKWQVDYVFLLPIDEGAAIVSSVSSSDRILIDSLSDAPGVYMLNGSDVVQQFATFTGGPFDLGPEDTRVYVLRDDTGNPSDIQFTLTPTYVPRVGGL
ncbi:MAG: hypothetical protein QF898_06085 [SAR202 cluster bacterium]|jgi:hypothetical protein|nr:hypothetical protein [SAR202 cluster bacterium]